MKPNSKKLKNVYYREFTGKVTKYKKVEGFVFDCEEDKLKKIGDA
jgi:hypothetical protein